MQKYDAAPSTGTKPVLRRASLARIAALLAIVSVALLLPAGEQTPAHDGSTGARSAARYAGMPQPEAMAAPTGSELVESQQLNTSTSYSLSSTSIRLRAGDHSLFQFNSTGAVARKRTIRLASATSFATPQTLSTFGGLAYAKLESGSNVGWYVRAAQATPSSLTTFSQPTQVRLQGGTHTGLRFYNKRRVAVRRSATLPAAEVFSVSKQATFGTRTYFYVSSGPLAERWVRKSAAVTLVSNTTTSPISAPAARWKAIVLIYRETDVTFTRTDGSSYRLRARMSDSMYGLSRDVIKKFVASASSWSDNYTALDLTVVDVPTPLTNVEQLGSGKYWVAPKSVRTAMDTYAPTGSYDSIFVLFEHKDSAGVMIPLAGWGMALAPGSWSNGAGFASIHTPSASWWWTDLANPEEVFVHEWMHQVVWFHESAGRLKLDLHAGTQYGYSASNGSWKTWLSDVMRGRVKAGSTLLGLNYDIWTAGKPTQP